ncbi:MAG TPA: type II toxin-antitoxin system HicA family toxin [Thermoanaerobaculia bacterium]|nr:type II toxin-antitoxin system HicA family toxin [Thermoanaerobaculia bacterium]
MKRRDLEAHLRRHDCELLREDARHTVYINVATGKKAAVPRHSEIKTPTAREVCTALGIPLP